MGSVPLRRHTVHLRLSVRPGNYSPSVPIPTVIGPPEPCQAPHSASHMAKILTARAILNPLAYLVGS